MNEQQQQTLLDVAEQSIRHALSSGSRWQPHLSDYESELSAEGASFVTLERGGNLRGCIGSLEAHRPLVEDVAHNAHAAAFEDPRFPPLREDELEGLELHISLLSAAEPIAFRSEGELLQQIRPGIDGLILSDGYRRGTFLPSVWSQLPRAEQFLAHLKLKAGLPSDYWSDTIRVERYTTEIFGRTITE